MAVSASNERLSPVTSENRRTSPPSIVTSMPRSRCAVTASRSPVDEGVAVGAALAPEVKTRLDNVNQIAVGNTPEEFATFLRENSERLNQVVLEARIKPS